MSMFEVAKYPDDFLAPGKSAFVPTIRQAMGDGVGGSLQVTTWLTIVNPPSLNGRGDVKGDTASVGVQVFVGPNAVDARQVDLDPGEPFSYEVPEGQPFVEIYNNGPVEVDDGKGGKRPSTAYLYVNVHTQPR